MTYKEAYTQFFGQIANISAGLFGAKSEGAIERKVAGKMRQLEHYGINPDAEFTGTLTLRSLSKNSQLLYADTAPRTETIIQSFQAQPVGNNVSIGSETGAASQTGAGLNFALLAAIVYMLWRLFL